MTRLATEASIREQAVVSWNERSFHGTGSHFEEQADVSWRP
jgi:hypothetical protein